MVLFRGTCGTGIVSLSEMYILTRKEAMGMHAGQL
jgi:hypothetical protein